MYKITIEQDFNKIMRRIQMCFIYIYAMSWPRAVLLRFFLHFFFVHVCTITDWRLSGRASDKTEIKQNGNGRKRKNCCTTLAGCRSELTCTEPCRSAGVRLPSVAPDFGTSGHAATPPLAFVCGWAGYGGGGWSGGEGFGQLVLIIFLFLFLIGYSSVRFASERAIVGNGFMQIYQ